MSGTKQGGINARNTNKERYGEDYYVRIGAMGGKKGHTGGFYANRDLARRAGMLGGTKSRRGPATPEELDAQRQRRKLALINSEE